MKLVRRKSSGIYLAADGNWVTDYRSAKDFGDVASAIAAVAKSGIKDVELVLVMGKEPSDRFDIVLPLFRNYNPSTEPLRKTRAGD